MAKRQLRKIFKYVSSGLAAVFLAASIGTQSFALPPLSLSAKFRDVAQQNPSSPWRPPLKWEPPSELPLPQAERMGPKQLAAALTEYLKQQNRDPAPVNAILEASEQSGMDFRIMLAVALLESDLGRRDAPAVGGSARGLYQYMPATWLAAFARYGAGYEDGKYSALAEAIKFDREGNASIGNRAQRKEILALRSDHKVAAWIKAMHFKYDEGPALRELLSREPVLTDYYMLHLLGKKRTTVFYARYTGTPEASAPRILRKEARYNRPLFYDGKKALDFAQVYRKITAMLENRLKSAEDNALKIIAAAEEPSVKISLRTNGTPAPAEPRPAPPTPAAP